MHPGGPPLTPPHIPPPAEIPKTSYTGTLGNPLGKAWADTFRTLTHGLTGDPFSGGATGGFANPTTVNPVTKERSYSASAYFTPAQNWPNLHLQTGSEVTQITLDNRDGLAITNGVVVTNKGTRQVFTPDREVILAAGTMNSTKILRIVWDRQSGHTSVLQH